MQGRQKQPIVFAALSPELNSVVYKGRGVQGAARQATEQGGVRAQPVLPACSLPRRPRMACGQEQRPGRVGARLPDCSAWRGRQALLFPVQPCPDPGRPSVACAPLALARAPGGDPSTSGLFSAGATAGKYLSHLFVGSLRWGSALCAGTPGSLLRHPPSSGTSICATAVINTSFSWSACLVGEGHRDTERARRSFQERRRASGVDAYTSQISGAGLVSGQQDLVTMGQQGSK